MRNINRWIALILLAAALPLAGCTEMVVEAQPAEPARVEHLEGANPTRVTLTEEAAKRLDLQTVPVREEMVDGMQRDVIPYASILYDPEGNTWTYTSSGPFTFVREPITVDRIEGDKVVLSDGPAPGTPVVTAGAAELFGSESEFEEE